MCRARAARQAGQSACQAHLTPGQAPAWGARPWLLPSTERQERQLLRLLCAVALLQTDLRLGKDRQLSDRSLQGEQMRTGVQPCSPSPLGGREGVASSGSRPAAGAVLHGSESRPWAASVLGVGCCVRLRSSVAQGSFPLPGRGPCVQVLVCLSLLLWVDARASRGAVRRKRCGGFGSSSGEHGATCLGWGRVPGSPGMRTFRIYQQGHFARVAVFIS